MKDTVTGTKRQTTDWEEMFAQHMSDKGLVSRIYEELLKFSSEKTIRLKDGPSIQTDPSPRKITLVADDYEKCSVVCHQENAN